jgi:hypothetical protein
MMIEKKINIKGNALYYNGDQIFVAESDIEKFLVFNNNMEFIIVLVDAAKLKTDRNIFCYGLDTKLKWQIPEPDKLHNENYYTSIYLSDGNLYAYNINGVEVIIDKQTGNILSKQLIK